MFRVNFLKNSFIFFRCDILLEWTSNICGEKVTLHFEMDIASQIPPSIVAQNDLFTLVGLRGVRNTRFYSIVITKNNCQI